MSHHPGKSKQMKSEKITSSVIPLLVMNWKQQKSKLWEKAYVLFRKKLMMERSLNKKLV